MEKIKVWDLPTRIGHWSLVVAFAVAWWTGDSERMRLTHVVAGFVMASILVFRIFWGLAGSRYARFSAFLFSPRDVVAYLKGLLRGEGGHWVGHNPAGSYAIYALVLLGLAVSLSGWAVYVPVWPEELEEVHEALSYAMLGVVGLHIMGVLVSSLLHRENLIRSMVTGYKFGKPEDGIPGMKAAWLIVLFGFMLGGWWLGRIS
jgi:cytochrome b